MRLATLARKIKMNPTRLISYLEDEGMKLDAGSNTKLDAITVDGILRKFAPELIEVEPEKVEAPDTGDLEESDSKEIPAPAEPEGKILKKEWSDELELPIDSPIETNPEVEELPSTESQEEEDDEIEVIKAPKIKLPGLKIKGKIELPENPKKPEVVKEEKVEEIHQKEQRNQRKGIGNKNLRRKERDPDYNPLEEARKRAAREKQRKKEQEAKRKKEKRKERYEKEIQSKIKAQAPKKVTEQVSEEILPEQPEISPPRNIFSRFLRWLNT